MSDDEEFITLPMFSDERQLAAYASQRAGRPQYRVPPPRPTERMPPIPPSILTVDELAHLLRVNRKTVYAALSRGEIPGARRLGATYRIHRDAVLDWLASSQGRVSRSRSHR